jgi:hypothetical protein
LALVPRPGAETNTLHGVFVWSEPSRAAVGLADHGYHHRADVLDGGRCLAGFSSPAQDGAGVLLVPLDHGDVSDHRNDVAPDDPFVVLKRPPPYAVIPHSTKEALAELRHVPPLFASRLPRRGMGDEGGIEPTLDLVENVVPLIDGDDPGSGLGWADRA